jgi:pyruvate dehydrogenase phosphatase
MSYFTFNSDLKAECAAASTEATAQAQFTRNTLEKRAFVLQYPANDPCEDRFNCY